MLLNHNAVNSITQWSPTFLAPGTCFMEDNFSVDHGVEGIGFGTLHLLCPLFLLLLYQLHLRSSGIRFQRLGTPAITNPPKALAHVVMNSQVWPPETATVQKMPGNLGISKNSPRTPLKEKDTNKCSVKKDTELILGFYLGKGFRSRRRDRNMQRGKTEQEATLVTPSNRHPAVRDPGSNSSSTTHYQFFKPQFSHPKWKE